MSTFGPRRRLWIPCDASWRRINGFQHHTQYLRADGKAICPTCGKLVVLTSRQAGIKSWIPNHAAIAKATGAA